MLIHCKCIMYKNKNLYNNVNNESWYSFIASSVCCIIIYLFSVSYFEATSWDSLRQFITFYFYLITYSAARKQCCVTQSYKILCGNSCCERNGFWHSIIEEKPSHSPWGMSQPRYPFLNWILNQPNISISWQDYHYAQNWIRVTWHTHNSQCHSDLLSESRADKCTLMTNRFGLTS